MLKVDQKGYLPVNQNVETNLPADSISLKAESKGSIRFLQTCTSMCTINLNINNASVFKYDLFSINFQILPTNKSIFPESKIVTLLLKISEKKKKLIR